MPMADSKSPPIEQYLLHKMKWMSYNLKSQLPCNGLFLAGNNLIDMSNTCKRICERMKNATTQQHGGTAI